MKLSVEENARVIKWSPVKVSNIRCLHRCDTSVPDACRVHTCVSRHETVVSSSTATLLLRPVQATVYYRLNSR